MERALGILSMEKAVRWVKDGVYVVRSQTGIGHYRIEYDGTWRCNCPDWIKREEDCKHTFAVRFWLDEADGKPEFRHKPTYTQNWPAYNRGQRNEIRLFDQMLTELLKVLPPEVPQKTGRPRISVQEGIICAIRKVASRLSMRRSQSLFGYATERGQLQKDYHYNVVSRFLNRKDITHALLQLVRETAKPLIDVENGEDGAVLAVDSTGFITTQFGNYHELKHGSTEKRKHKWIKAHFCVGVKTHIITSVAVTHGYSNDAPHFSPLVKVAADVGFKINEVSGDKAYSSKKNYALVESLGAKPYIPFQSNATSQARHPRAWKRAYYHFTAMRDDFDKHYHKRSNSETVMMAVKAKFGEKLKSKNDTAMVNEMLCKVIAYNISVVIHEMYEHGVSPEWLGLNKDD